MRLYPRKNTNGTVTWWASWTENKRTVRRSTREHTRELAAEVVEQWRRERINPELEKARKALFGDEASEWLRSCRARCKAGKLAQDTVNMYEQKLANLCDIIGRDTRMVDVDASRVLAYFDQRTEEGASSSTQFKEWIALRGVLSLSRHKGRYSYEVARVKPPGLRADYKPRKTRLSWEQADQLLEEIGTWTAIRPKVDKEIGPADRRRTVAFVLATGARRKEWHRAGRVGDGLDIDRARGVVRIHGTKTEEAAKEIPIPSPMRRWLEIAGDPPFPLWGNARRDIHAACVRIAKRTGKPFPLVTWNDLRRTFASLLVEAGVPHHLLKNLTRHNTTAMLDLVYGKPTTDAVAGLVEKAIRANADDHPSVNQRPRTKKNRSAPRETS